MIAWLTRVLRPVNRADHLQLLHDLRTQTQIAELQRALLERQRKRDLADAFTQPPRMPWTKEHPR